MRARHRARTRTSGIGEFIRGIDPGDEPVPGDELEHPPVESRFREDPDQLLAPRLSFQVPTSASAAGVTDCVVASFGAASTEGEASDVHDATIRARAAGAARRLGLTVRN